MLGDYLSLRRSAVVYHEVQPVPCWATMLEVVAGAIVMVIVLVIVFPVLVMLGSGILAAVLGSSLKRNSDADNHTDDEPNEYLELSRKEAEIGYPET